MSLLRTLVSTFWPGAWRAQAPEPPGAIHISPIGDAAFHLEGPRRSLGPVRGDIESLIRRYGGRRQGLFNPTYALPVGAYAELAQALPDHHIDPAYRERLERYCMSAAVDYPQPVPGLYSDELGIELYPFQKAAIAYLLRAKQCVLGDEAGVGKTFAAIAAAHMVRQGPVIVVCPANLKLNWASEIQRARPEDEVMVCKGQTPRALLEDGWIILNYDIAAAWADALSMTGANVVIFDEIHNCKNPSAQRSRACLEIARGREYRFGLTGTLFRNRHAEAFFPLRVLGQTEALGGERELVRRFCGDTESSSINSDGFNRHLRFHCYVRREKRDVLTQLPQKSRAHLVVEMADATAYRQQETGLIQWLKGLRKDKASMAAARMDALARMNQLRQQAGLGKVGAAIEWIADYLDQSSGKLVVFAYHKAVQRALMAAFPDALHIVSEDPMKDRQAAKEAFQTDPDQRLILCALHVASEGITLTAASAMLCVELDYVPAMLFDQMEGRIDRNGQTQPTQIYYMLAADSIDQRMMKLLEHKWHIVTAANTGQAMEANDSIFDELLGGYMT